MPSGFKSSNADVVIEADGVGSEIVFKQNGVEVGRIGAGGLGKVLQVVQSVDGEVATGTAIIPNDDTIPQVTEGTEFLSVSITPSKATSKLKITVKANIAISTTNAFVGAVFLNGGADAIASSKQNVGANNVLNTQTIVAYVNAVDTNLHTISYRCGAVSTATTTFNGQSGARFFGGSLDSQIIVEEIGA